MTEDLSRKQFYLKVGSDNNNFVSKIVKKDSIMNWDDSFKFELKKMDSQMAFLIELWQYSFKLSEDYNDNLLASSDILINMNELQSS